MKNVMTLLLVLCSTMCFSQTTYYHHGFDGLLLWEKNDRPERDLIISSFGARTSIKEEVGYLLYYAYTSGKIDSTMSDYVFSTSDFKVSGFLDFSYTDSAILIDFTYDRIQWPDGRVEIYQPLD